MGVIPGAERIEGSGCSNDLCVLTKVPHEPSWYLGNYSFRCTELLGTRRIATDLSDLDKNSGERNLCL